MNLGLQLKDLLTGAQSGAQLDIAPAELLSSSLV